MKIDDYKHLDIDSKVSIELSIPEIAKRVIEMNYGTHRMLSAMVHELRDRERQRAGRLVSPLADVIEKALNDGLYY